MNYQSFQNCVRAYFPRIRFYDRLIYLFPNDLTKHRANNDALVQLCKEFNLPYARVLIRNFWKSQNLVIGHSDWTNAWETVMAVPTTAIHSAAILTCWRPKNSCSAC